MAKRFTDTEIWEQDWFIDLLPKHKLLWNYIKDKCDNVGIWRPNKVLAERIIGERINENDFLTAINLDKIRVFVLPNGRWFLKDFFIFQYGNTFSPTSLVHKGALKQLVTNGIHIKDILEEKEIGDLFSVDIQELKAIAYAKGIDSLLIAFGRVKEKENIYLLDNKVKNNENGTKKQFSGNFKAQGEELFAQRFAATPRPKEI